MMFYLTRHMQYYRMTFHMQGKELYRGDMHTYIYDNGCVNCKIQRRVAQSNYENAFVGNAKVCYT
jgi:hypothetical protein